MIVDKGDGVFVVDAKAELDVIALAQRYGFGQGGLPTPTGTPCTAVRSTEWIR